MRVSTAPPHRDGPVAAPGDVVIGQLIKYGNFTTNFIRDCGNMERDDVVIVYMGD